MALPVEALQDMAKEVAGVVIPLTPGQSPLFLCRYPISGYYGTLPRILFYVTIVAALLLRHHTWLFVGALASSLTYSGSAAIHACVLIWSGRAYGELDVVGIVAVLSVSCIVTVPLLSWSATIRNAGLPLREARRQREKIGRLLKQLEQREERRVFTTGDDEERHRETFERRRQHLLQRGNTHPEGLDSASRTILLFWSFLVTVGFCCGFVAVVDRSPDAHYGHFQNVDYSLAPEIRCTPDGGQLDLSAGLSGNASYLITSNFIAVNNCIDPCPNFPLQRGPVYFRENKNSVAFENNLVDGIFDQKGAGKRELINVYTYNMSWIIVYVLIQGVVAIFLGRSAPSESRVRIYRGAVRMHLRRRSSSNGEKPLGRFQAKLAMTLAFITYIWAVCTAIIALPLLIVNVTVIEIYIYYMPQSEKPFYLGAWTPYTATGLALFSMVIANSTVKEQFGKLLSTTLNNIRGVGSFAVHRQSGQHSPDLNMSAYKDTLRSAWAIFFVKPVDFFVAQKNDVLDGLSCEWENTVNFWNNPDDEVAKLEARWKMDMEYHKGVSPESPEPGILGSNSISVTEMQNVEMK